MMSDSKESSVFDRESCQQHDEPRCRRSRLRASLSVSSILRKIVTDVDSPSVAPEPVDLRITQGLLSGNTLTTSSKANTRSMSRQGDLFTSSLYHDHHTSGASVQTGEPQGHSRITSTTWSTVSNRVFANSSRSSERDALEFLAEYNRLGSKHGLPQLCHDVPPTIAAGTTHPSNQPPINRLFRKLLRKVSSVQTMRNCSNPRLTRIPSISGIVLTDRGRKDILKDRTLEDIARLGGESVFLLPVGSAPGPLMIPSCFSATGMYILQHGIKTPGIFRVPGSSIITNTLYDHYSRQFQDAEKSIQLVHQTVSSGQIPHHIPCSIHDVASVFKKFLVGLPGGILGSVPLFNALRNIHTALFPSPDLPESHQRKIEARLIALAIASLGSEHSVALICAVFGLLNVVGYEVEDTSTTDEGGQIPAAKDMMGYEALGVIFGPLLLGSKMELVELYSEDDRGGLLVIPESPTRRRGGRRKKSVVKATCNNVNAQVGKARMAAGVAEMLIRNWKEVVRQLSNIGAVDSAQLTETVAEDVVGNDASAATTEASEYPLEGREPSNYRRVAEITGKRSKRMKSSQSIGDITAVDLQTLRDSDAWSIQLSAQIRSRPHSNNENPLGPAMLDNLNSIELADNLSLVRYQSRQLQHPRASKTILQDPISAAGSCPVSMHHAGFSGETIRPEQMGSGEVPSNRTDRKSIEIALPGSPIGETIGSDGGDYPQKSTDSCSRHAAAIDGRMPTVQTGLSEGGTDQEINPLAMASGHLARAESPRMRGIVESQGLQGSNSLEDPQLVTSHGTPDQESSHRPGMDVGNQLPPQSTGPDDVLLCAGFGDHTRYSLSHNQFQRTSSSGPQPAGSGALQLPEWLIGMGKAALGAEAVAMPVHEKKQQKLDDGPQSCTKDSEFSTIPGKQTDLSTPETSYDVKTVKAGNTTPPSFAKSQNSLQSFDISRDQDVPTRTSSIPQTVAKYLAPTDTMPVRHRSETPIDKPGTASADQLDRLLPPDEEPEVARHIHWRNSSELGTSRASSEQGLTPKLSLKGNATLYAEIWRLQRLIDFRTEEAIQAQRELEAIRKFKDSGTLSEKLREAQRDLKTWRNRAEWAEKRLLMQDMERRGTAPTRKKDEEVGE